MSDLKRRNVGGVAGSADERARELIGQAIRIRRERAEMTQAQAAEALGVSRDTLIQWEKGRGSLWVGGDAGCTDLKVMARLKEVYKARWDELPRNQYPGASLDPALRRDYFWRRNARIQGFDEEWYVGSMKAKREAAMRGEKLAPWGADG